MKNRKQGIEELTNINETSKRLQKEGLDREALDCMQLGLVKCKEIFGPKSEELTSACRTVANELNNTALKNIHESHFNEAAKFLKQASLLFRKNDDFGRQQTYQNFALLYQKKGQPKMTLKYLKQVLSIHSKFLGPSLDVDDIQRAHVQLNICATLSQLGKHESALRHANLAIRTLKSQTNGDTIENHQNYDLSVPRLSLEMDAIGENESGASFISVEENMNPKLVEMLALSYYNAGVEYEHLNDIHRSYHAYQQGIEIAFSLGCHHEVTKVLNSSSQELHKRILQDTGKELRKSIVTL